MRRRSLIMTMGLALLLSATSAIDAKAVRLDAQIGATSGCAATAPTQATGSSHPGSGVLVPQGAVAVLLCRYQGLNPPATAHHLERAHLITAAARVGQLTTAFNALPRAAGVYHCPMDDGSEITATFRYRHALPAAVAVGLTGCRTVSRGNIVRTASGAAGSRLISQLSALVP